MKFKNFFVKNNKYKKFFLIAIFFVLAIFLAMFDGHLAIAESSIDNTYNVEINRVVEEIVNDINFDDLENTIQGFDDLNLIGRSLKDKVLRIINGDYFSDYSSVFLSILSIFVVDIKQFLPFIFTIIAIGISSNLISEFKSNSDNTGDILHLVCLSIMSITIIFVFKDVLQTTSNILQLLLKQMKIIFPILITLMTSIGSFSSISIYNPLVAVLCTIVGFVFEKLLFPIFIVSFIFILLGNITDMVKLDKFQNFLLSGFKWIVGLVFTLFMGFLTIQGISAGRYDSVGIKATKFAVKSYIPIIGSYISEGMDFLVLGSVLVKNTVGLVGILILFITILSPIVSLLIIKFGLHFCSAILDMCGSKRISNFIHDCSKILILPIVLILGVSFMYLITVALIMCTANIF